MTNSASEDCHFEILGQKFPLPNTIAGAVGWGLICITLVSITYIIAVVMPESRFERLAGLFEAHYYNSQGKTVPYPKTKILGFWTPSEETKKYLKRDSAGALIDPNDKWMEITEKSLTDFENKLGEIGVHGWRRYKIVGLGRSQVKTEGWWWTVSVDVGFETSSLVQTYADHWKNERTLYMEEIGGAAEYKGGENQ